MLDGCVSNPKGCVGRGGGGREKAAEYSLQYVLGKLILLIVEPLEMYSRYECQYYYEKMLFVFSSP